MISTERAEVLNELVKSDFTIQPVNGLVRIRQKGVQYALPDRCAFWPQINTIKARKPDMSQVYYAVHIG